MTEILTFETKHGTITVEMDENVAAAAGGGVDLSEYQAKGPGSSLSRTGEIVAGAPNSFDDAMSSLRAYAASLEDLIQSLHMTPKAVSAEIGLKFSGTAGFIIAKAGMETETKVALTWEPGGKS